MRAFACHPSLYFLVSTSAETHTLILYLPPIAHVLLYFPHHHTSAARQTLLSLSLFPKVTSFTHLHRLLQLALPLRSFFSPSHSFSTTTDTSTLMFSSRLRRCLSNRVGPRVCKPAAVATSPVLPPHSTAALISPMTHQPTRTWPAAPPETPLSTGMSSGLPHPVCVPQSPLLRGSGTLSGGGGVGSPTGVQRAPHDLATERPPTATEKTHSMGLSRSSSKPSKRRSTHEDLFSASDSARRALDSLLGNHHAASTAHDGEDDIDAVAVADLEDDRASEEVADETGDTAIPATPASPQQKKQKKPQRQASADHPSITTTTTATTTATTPCTPGGIPYPQTVATTLTEVAAAHGFHSPIWTTRAQFTALGFHVDAEPSAGALVPTTNGDTTFYNLEQTSGRDASAHELADKCTAAGVRLQRTQRVSRRGSTTTEGGCAPGQEAVRLSHAEYLSRIPHDIRGVRLFSTWSYAVRHSPRFHELQAASPFWIALSQAVALNVEVREEERAHAVAIPPSTRTAWSARESETDQTTAPDDHTAAVFLSHAEAAHANPHDTLVYNCSQLTNPERFTTCALGWECGCFNKSGHRYSPTMSFLMLEYCQAHNFTLRDPLAAAPPETLDDPPHASATGSRWHIVFCTEAHLERLGGIVLPWPRGATENQTPPYTVVARDGGLIVLVNAEQSSVYQEIKQACEVKLEERKDFYRQSKRSTPSDRPDGARNFGEYRD